MLGLPKTTECQKIIPKKVIYEKNELSAATKARMDADIRRVTIVNIVSPAQVALSAGESVQSFCVALVDLKQKDYDEKNLVLLTKLVKQNMLLVLEFGGRARLAAYHTRLLCSDWAELDSLSVSLKGLNLDVVWENILAQIGNVKVAEGNTLAQQIQQDDERLKIQKQVAQLEAQARRENNPRKKFELVQRAKALSAYEYKKNDKE